jgi:2-polyprenyl-3-methyl-5-hydroxy-6-metoxy-1,4-benzoquinol methylase
MTDEYIMGRTSGETERLQIQGRLFSPGSALLLRMAGITPGMRVLDVGCGAGDVSLLLAEAVGPDGTVTGVDVNPAILELARARAAEAGLANVSFRAGDLADLRLEEPVDAVVGRLILLHVKDPAATVRSLSRLVRRGGLVTFQEINMPRCRAVPTTPLATKYISWIIDAFRAIGVNPNLGEQVASLLAEADLAVEGAASANVGGPADSVMPQYVADTFRSVLPAVLAHCGVTEAEADVDTLRERLARECKEADATLWMPELVASWARVPAVI